MLSNCPTCGAPITSDARFCSHCGNKLPDDTQRVEVKSDIKIEDVAKVEEVRLKYALEEKKHQDTLKRNESRFLKVKLWCSWLLCVIAFCVGTSLSFTRKYDGWSASLAILSMASGIYAIVLTLSLIIRKILKK